MCIRDRLTGGSIAVLGTVLAAFVTRLIDAARAQFSLDPSWVNLLIGLVVLGTVAGGRLHQTRLEKATTTDGAALPQTGGAQ